MSKQQLRFEQFFAAPRSEVFAYFADHERFGRLWPGRTRRIHSAADPGEPNGLGSVREIRLWPIRLEETITGFTPGQVIEYQITRGGMLRKHHGCLRFESVAGGTKLAYDIRFDCPVPLMGGVIAGVLCASFRRGIPRVVDDISAAR
ncbi:MAG: SRPBCC family protein [Panacagrimonas sp.]